MTEKGHTVCFFLSDHLKTPHALSSCKRPLPARSETLYIDLHNPFLSDYKHGSKMPRQHNKAAGLGVEGGSGFSFNLSPVCTCAESHKEVT